MKVTSLAEFKARKTAEWQHLATHGKVDVYFNPDTAEIRIDGRGESKTTLTTLETCFFLQQIVTALEGVGK